VNPVTTSAFDLPERLSAKADPKLIAGDEQHFAAVAKCLEHRSSSWPAPGGRTPGTRRQGSGGAADRYVAMTRATQQLVIIATGIS